MESKILIKFFEEEEENGFKYLREMFKGLYEFFKNYVLLVYLLFYMGVGLIHEIILIISNKFTKKSTKNEVTVNGKTPK